MSEVIIFVDSTEEFNSSNFNKLELPKIFSFNINTHNFLEKKKIVHNIGENYLKSNDREKIFDYSIKLWNWYDDDLLKKEFQFKNINFLSVADTSEFHQIIIREIFNFIVIKRIIESEQPKKIILSSYFAKIVKQIDDTILLEIPNEKEVHDFHIQWEKMLIRFNLFNFPVSIPISRKRFNQFKKFFEFFVGNLFGLWQNFKNKKPSILFLEFNPAQYSGLLDNLKNFDGNIIFFNRRRPAIWNIQSIKLVRKYNIKLISSEHSLSKHDKIDVDSSLEYFRNKLQQFWSNEIIFSKIFKIEGINFWPIISDVLYEVYSQRIREYLKLILISKRVLSELNIKCILSLNVLGETEKIILSTNDCTIPSILLEHGASNYTTTISKYEISQMYSLFRDKIALWGNVQKDFLTDNLKINPDRILTVGSPRHEDFFKKSKLKHTNSEKIILLTPMAMSEFNGNIDTNTYLRYEKLLVKIFNILKKIPNTKIIVKMHPTLSPGNEYIKKLIYNLNSDVNIFQMESVLDVIESCDVMLNITTELFPSTILYEAMIMNKPVMNIDMMDKKLDLELFRDNAVLSFTDNDDLEEKIEQFVIDDSLQTQLIIDSKKHLKKYFSNPIDASKKLSDVLLSYTNE